VFVIPSEARNLLFARIENKANSSLAPRPWARARNGNPSGFGLFFRNLFSRGAHLTALFLLIFSVPSVVKRTSPTRPRTSSDISSR
jgi:hypothetical protein